MVSTPESPNIQNRKGLYSYLESRMEKSYLQIRDDLRNEYQNSSLKSFLLECDWTGDTRQQFEEIDYLEKLLSIKPSGRKKLKADAKVESTSDDGLYKVSWERKEKNTSLYLDTGTELGGRRFWQAYSVSPANDIDEIIFRLIDSKPHLDSLWFWSQFLESAQDNGESKGSRFEHDDSLFDNSESSPGSAFSLEFSPNTQKDDEELLKLLKESNHFAPKTSLSKVRLKYWENQSAERFSIETLYFNGKSTTNGTSFSAHQELLEKLQTKYKEKLSFIEEKYIIQATGSEQQWHIQGSPILFRFKQKQIEDVDHFCQAVFSGKPPFKLWGIPRETSTGQGRTVLAVDFHNGGKFFFEVYTDMICMYLSKGVCGNSAIRFYTNLQKNFSRLVEVQNESGSNLF